MKVAGLLVFFVAALFATIMFLVSLIGHESVIIARVAAAVPFLTPFVIVALWSTLYPPAAKPGRPRPKAIDLLLRLQLRTVWMGAVGYVLVLVVVAALVGEVPE